MHGPNIGQKNFKCYAPETLSGRVGRIEEHDKVLAVQQSKDAPLGRSERGDAVRDIHSLETLDRVLDAMK